MKQGYVRVRSKRVAFWRKRWLILRRASSKGPCRLEKHCDERSARGTSYAQKTTLLNCVVNVCRISSTVRPHAFAVTFDSRLTKCFACDSGEWTITHMQTAQHNLASPSMQTFNFFRAFTPHTGAKKLCAFQARPFVLYVRLG